MSQVPDWDELPDRCRQTRVSGIDPTVHQQVLVHCPWCGAHHKHGVAPFDYVGGVYVAYRVAHCTDKRGREDDRYVLLGYQITDPDNLIRDYLRPVEPPTAAELEDAEERLAQLLA